MTKQGVKEQAKPKSLRDQKKELESRLFGEKNNSKKKEIQGMIKKIDLALKQENDLRLQKDKERKDAQIVKQLIPVGVDPKTVQCINFLNGNCDKGDDCQFGHNVKKEAKKEAAESIENRPKCVCRFLVDAINSGEYTKNWVCPFPNCSDIHRLVELGNNSEIEISLEEYIELQRQNVDETIGTPVTEESFNAWKAKKDKEEEMHLKRVAALSTNVKGVDLFKMRPEIFEDDAEVIDDVDYTNRIYGDSDEEVATEG